MNIEKYLNIPGITVSGLQKKHIPGILELMNREGWYYYDARELGRYMTLAQDCITLLKGGAVIGCICSTNYGDQAWIGNIVVAQEERGKGLATAMLRGMMDYLHKVRNIPVFRLGSVPLAIGLYKKMGFRAESFTSAQEADLPLHVPYDAVDPGENVRTEMLEANDLTEISELDTIFFKSDRFRILQDLYHHSLKKACVCLRENKRIVGFIMIRRRQMSKEKGAFAEGPDFAYRLGPCCVLPKYGVKGFKALFQEAIKAVNKEAEAIEGTAKIYVVFPINADRHKIYQDTLDLAKGMDMNIDLDLVFDEHAHIFGGEKSGKNDEQWDYMQGLGFHQEYFEQVMSCTPGEAMDLQPNMRKAHKGRSNPEGIFASATPGDKA